MVNHGHVMVMIYGKVVVSVNINNSYRWSVDTKMWLNYKDLKWRYYKMMVTKGIIPKWHYFSFGELLSFSEHDIQE